MGAKAHRWLSGGVRLVWLVLPEERVVEVWQGAGLVRVVSAEEELSGEEVLPGFVLPARNLFPWPD
jgi:Uma2 family endonuclease